MKAIGLLANDPYVDACLEAGEGPAFTEQPLGATYEVTVRKGQGGATVFVAAKMLP